MILAIKITKSYIKSIAFVTNYEPIKLTHKPELTTFYQYMSELLDVSALPDRCI